MFVRQGIVEEVENMNYKNTYVTIDRHDNKVRLTKGVTDPLVKIIFRADTF